MSYMRVLYLFGLGLLTVGCSSELDEVSSTTSEGATSMRVPVVIPSLTDTAMLSPVFLFWDASTFLAGEDPDLFFVAEQTQSVYDYYPTDTVTLATDRTTWYDTGHPYLNDDETVLVSGFIPLTVASEDYKSIVLLPDMWARDSVWIAKEARLGSSYNPFSQALRFVHATTQVIFKAQLADGMVQPIRDVQVVVHPEGAVLYAMRWQSYDQATDLTKCGFVADTTDNYTNLSEAEQQTVAKRLTLQSSTPLPFYSLVAAGGASPVEVGSVYVKPELETLCVDVHAKMGANGQESYDVLNRTITLNETLHSGDSYVITLMLDMLTIEVEGRKQDFDDGGTGFLTIQPFY